MALLVEEMLDDIRLVFKFAALSLECRKETVKDTIRRRFFFIFNSLMAISDVIMFICWFIDGIGNGTSFTELTFVFPGVSFGTIAVIKSIYLAMKEDSINQIIEDMRALEVKRLDKINNNVQTVINKEAKFLKLIIKIFFRTHGLNIVFFIVSPLALIVIKYIKTDELEFRLPILDIYLFGRSSVICWLIKFIKQMYSILFVIVNMCAAEFFFFSCCTYLRIQFILLQHNIQELIPDNILNDLMRYNNDVRNKLLELIQWHQSLIRTLEHLEDIYTQSNLMNFVISSIVICLDGFNIVAIKEVEFLLTCISFLVLCLFQVFFLCYFGDLLINSSTAVSDSIYNCRWYLMDCAFRKDILIMLIRSQRACKLTAWGYADINLNSFMRVLSTSWSYLALLNTMYDQQN